MTGILTIDLELPGVGSLKEKRRIIKSLMTRLRNDFNISIAEVANNELLQRATLGAAVVSNENSYCHQVMAKVVNKIEASGVVNIIDYTTESY